MVGKIDRIPAVIVGCEGIIVKNIIDPEGWEIACIGTSQETRSGLAERIMKS